MLADRPGAQVDGGAAVRAVNHPDRAAQLRHLLRGERPDEVLLLEELGEPGEAPVPSFAAQVLEARVPLSQTGQRHFGGNGGAGSFDSSAIMRKRVSVAAGVRCTVSNGSNQKAWQYGQSETSTAEPRSASTVTSRIALRQPGQFIFRSLGHHGNGSNPCLSLRSLARTAR